MHFARFALPLASQNLLPLTLSSNVTTQPIKLVYWRSLFHLFGKTQIHLVFRSLIRNFAPRNQQEEGNYAETIDDDRADDLVCRYGRMLVAGDVCKSDGGVESRTCGGAR